MMKTNFYVNWITLTWRFKINFKKITIQFFRNFFDLDDKMFVYALMCSTFDVKIIPKMRKLFKFLKSYENCFDFKKVKTFLEHENENHVINLIPDVKSLYKSFYILFEIKFNILRDYLLKNLILNCIRKFTSRTNVSMFFIFKKDNNFKLCIDHKQLNIFIIKNKYLLSLIDETLNRFINVAYFIKLYFKNAYHWIKIRKNNKWMITFCTRYNHIEYTVIFFELDNVFVIFQILINKIVQNLIDHICVIYLNDILIYFKIYKKHWKYVRKMLERLYQFKLYTKLSKYFFLIQIIELPEYIINNYKVSMNSYRMKVI